MTPGAPAFVGVLTTCSRTVRLQGLLQNAVVRLLADGIPVELGRATWPDQVFDLPTGFSLKAGSQLRTQQTLAGVDSAPSSFDLPVAAVAPVLPAPLVASPLVACARLVVVDGLTPDSLVTVRDAGGLPLGNAASLGSSAEVTLSASLGVGAAVTVAEDSCGSLATATSLPAETIGPANVPLQPPVFAGGVHDCQRLLSFSNLRPGSQLVLTRGDGTELDFRCSRDTLTARVDPPVGVAETLVARVVRTDFCEAEPSDDVKLVSGSDPLPPPRVTARPCPESALILLAGLTASARVRLSRAGVDLVEFDAAAESSPFDLAGTGLAPGDIVQVTQDLCATRSAPATFVVQAPSSAVSLDFVEKPVRCARIVLVEGVPEGSLVRVFSQQIGVIGWAVGDGYRLGIPVVPALLDGDVVEVTVSGCVSGSLAARVEEPNLGDPIIVRAIEGETQVGLDQLLPGSVVDVTSLDTGITVLSAIATSRTQRLATNRPLVADEGLVVTARWCEQIRRGGSARVEKRRPVRMAPSTGRGMVNAGGKWFSGRIQAVLPFGPGQAVAGGEASGLWTCQLGAPPVSLSFDWDDPQITCLATDPTTPNQHFAGTMSGLRATDPTIPLPASPWSPVTTAPAGAIVHAVLVSPAHGIVALGTNRGLWTAPLVSFRTTPFTQVEGSANEVWSLGLGPDDSIVAYSSIREGGGTAQVTVGSGAGTLTWTDRTPAGADPRIAQILASAAVGVVAVAPSDRNRIYLSLDNPVGHGWFPVMRSDDGGISWTIPSTLTVAENDTGGSPDGLTTVVGLAAWRNQVLVVDPASRDLVLLGGTRTGLLASTDGAVTYDAASWPVLGQNDFHPDMLCAMFDPADATGMTLWAGNDGGIYRSTDGGHSWDSSLNADLPTLMSNEENNNFSSSLAANPADVDVLAAGFQDLGLGFLSAQGALWTQVVGGDGTRALFIDDGIVLMSSNDAEGSLWYRWDGTTMIKRTSVNADSNLGTSDPIHSRVVTPVYADSGGHLMIAIAADDDQPGIVYGLFDTAPGTDDDTRYSWTIITTVPGKVHGLGSWDGREILVSCSDTQPGKDAKGNPIPVPIGHSYRIDTGSATFVEMPTGTLSPSIGFRYLTAVGQSSYLALDDQGVLESDDAATWHRLAISPSSSGSFASIGVDRNTSPNTIFGGNPTGLWSSADHGATWALAQGLPSFPRVVQIDLVSRAAGSRLTVGTWNWGTWFADLQ